MFHLKNSSVDCILYIAFLCFVRKRFTRYSNKFCSYSAVAIPEVLNTCETKHGVCPNISRFFIPFATALNRTGSCIFITMAGLLLCSMEGQQLEGVKILFLAYVFGFLNLFELTCLTSQSTALIMSGRCLHFM